MAWRQGPQGSKQHLALAAPATRTRTQRPRKYLAIHAAELVVEPNFQILRRHRRSLLLRLEHAHRSAVENHVHRPPRLGSRRSLNLRIGINPRCKVRRRVGDDLHAKILQMLSRFILCKDTRRLAVKLVDDWLRSSGWRHQTKPNRRVETGESRFRECRDVG